MEHVHGAEVTDIHQWPVNMRLICGVSVVYIMTFIGWM